MNDSLLSRILVLIGLFSVAIVFVACQQMAGKGNEGTATTAPLKVSTTGFDGRQVSFIPQTNYVAMPLPFAPFSELYKQLSARVPEKLISRGEAHVTVLTPPEFDQLKTHLSIDEINAIATALDIQGAEVKPFCLGRGDAVIDGQNQKTFFVVVQAEGLLKIRLAIATEFVKRGGLPSAFDAEHFYPHVTIGFTKRDLFDQDGVIKSLKSCVYSLED